MSLRRVSAAAAIVLTALLVTPAALLPVVNSADLIVAGAPLALVAVVLWPRRCQTPAEGATPPESTSPGVEAPSAGPQ